MDALSVFSLISASAPFFSPEPRGRGQGYTWEPPLGFGEGREPAWVTVLLGNNNNRWRGTPMIPRGQRGQGLLRSSADRSLLSQITSQIKEVFWESSRDHPAPILSPPHPRRPHYKWSAPLRWLPHLPEVLSDCFLFRGLGGGQ